MDANADMSINSRASSDIGTGVLVRLNEDNNGAVDLSLFGAAGDTGPVVPVMFQGVDCVLKDHFGYPEESSKLSLLSDLECYSGKPSLEDYKCPICLDTFINTVKVDCSYGHKFCNYCIQCWISVGSQLVTECPVCRDSIFGKRLDLKTDAEIRAVIETLSAAERAARLLAIKERLKSEFPNVNFQDYPVDFHNSDGDSSSLHQQDLRSPLFDFGRPRPTTVFPQESQDGFRFTQDAQPYASVVSSRVNTYDPFADTMGQNRVMNYNNRIIGNESASLQTMQQLNQPSYRDSNFHSNQGNQNTSAFSSFIPIPSTSSPPSYYGLYSTNLWNPELQNSMLSNNPPNIAVDGGLLQGVNRAQYAGNLPGPRVAPISSNYYSSNEPFENASRRSQISPPTTAVLASAGALPVPYQYPPAHGPCNYNCNYVLSPSCPRHRPVPTSPAYRGNYIKSRRTHQVCSAQMGHQSIPISRNVSQSPSPNSSIHSDPTRNGITGMPPCSTPKLIPRMPGRITIQSSPSFTPPLPSPSISSPILCNTVNSVGSHNSSLTAGPVSQEEYGFNPPSGFRSSQYHSATNTNSNQSPPSPRYCGNGMPSAFAQQIPIGTVSQYPIPCETAHFSGGFTVFSGGYIGFQITHIPISPDEHIYPQPGRITHPLVSLVPLNSNGSSTRISLTFEVHRV